MSAATTSSSSPPPPPLPAGLVKPWEWGALTATGSPEMGKEEIQLLSKKDVTMYRGEEKLEHLQLGLLYLTNHRLFWLSPDRKTSLALHLSHVVAVEDDSAGFFHRSHKIMLKLRGTAVEYKVKFVEGDASLRSTWEGKMRKAVANKAWVQAKKQKAAFSTRAAGLTGLDRKAKRQAQRQAQVGNVAFQDLQSLMTKAKEIVTIAEYCSRNKQITSSADKEQFSSLVTQIGIANPVTRATAGDMFYAELARQLAAYLEPRLKAAGGMLALTDIYCLYNRARGSELISPDDLLAGCRQLGQLKLGMHLHTLPSGVMMLQLDSEDIGAVVERLKALVEAKGTRGVSAAEVAAEWSVSILVAQARLSAAEDRGSVCLDDSVEGLRYHPNLFCS